ncbi:MAG TPA: hypothetical protein VGN72_01870 [Tepidisphaeraceae bacterium]|jgi:hypothetical protein|nr:hypothetical protein [Tepidisphaeraceae bacterium]
MRALSALILLLSLASLAHGQTTDARRVLRSFDFEERQLGNVEPLPMNWVKVEGDAQPHYVNGQLASDRARSGKYSFRYDLNGGSLVYRYESGRIKIERDAHYRVEGFCQTTPMAHARVRMTAYFTDLDHRPVEASIVRSEPFVSPAGNRDWQKIAVELTATDPDATYLVVELSLLQPAIYRPTTLGKQALFPQDIRGSAWFDDIKVSQVPQVTLSTDRPGNIFRPGDSRRVGVLVNDKFTDDLSAQLVITDADGKSVYQRSGVLDMTGAQVLGPNRKHVTMSLPELPAGWYEAHLVMSSGGHYVGEQELAFIQLADRWPLRGSMPDARFGVTALDLPFDGWDELPELLPYLSVGRVKLAVWSASGDIESVDSIRFDTLLEQLQAMGVAPTACLTEPPPEMNQRLGGLGWPGLLKAPKEAWQPQLSYLLARHANHLDRWQLGADGTDAFVTDPAMRQVYHAVYAEFANLLMKPDLAMPWPAWYELDGEMPATVALSVPPSVLPSQLPLYMDDLTAQRTAQASGGATGAPPALSVSLQLLDAKQYGRQMQIRDFAERIVYALAGGAARIDVPLPFTVKRHGQGFSKQPQELLMIVRTLMTTLSGATYKGKMPMAEGIEAFLFDRAGQGIVVLWDRSAVPGKASGETVKQLTIDLGERPARIDLWGNTTPLLANPGAADGKMLLSVGAMPTILVNVDAPLAQMRASVSIDNPLLESSFKPHERHLRFSNPYRQAISGQVKLRAPNGWTLNPPTFTFSLNPGETFDREIAIEFPYNSFAGPKTLDAEFAVQADKNVNFTVPITVTLGLSDVGIQTIALREGNDILVQQMITNYGNEAIDYNAFAICPGQARQERLVTDLGPGRTMLKRYKFSNVNLPPNGRIRSGVKEQIGTRILNEEVPVQ